MLGPRETIENNVRSGVMLSGKGRYAEGSLRTDLRSWRDGPSTWYVRYQIKCNNGRVLWYGAEFTAIGELKSRTLFN